MKISVLLGIGFLIAQGFFGGGMPPETDEDPFSRATTPPAAFIYFNEDFASMDVDRLMSWVHPNRGLVKNGTLLTPDEVRESFGEDISFFRNDQLLSKSIYFNWGEWAGNSTFQADTWVDYAIRNNNVENVYTIHNVFVFEIIDNGWYLIQSEYIPTDPDLPLVRQGDNQNWHSEIPPEFRQFVSLYSEPMAGREAAWPLLLGTNFSGDEQLIDVKGTTPGGGAWSLNLAVSLGMPTVLNFLSLHSLFLGTEEEIDAQMDFMDGMYTTFGYEDLFIYSVTDNVRDVAGWLEDNGYNNFAVLLDEGSAIHLSLNIKNPPYTVVFDSDGTVICMTDIYHESSHYLVEERVREAVAKAQN